MRILQAQSQPHLVTSPRMALEFNQVCSKQSLLDIAFFLYSINKEPETNSRRTKQVSNSILTRLLFAKRGSQFSQAQNVKDTDLNLLIHKQFFGNFSVSLVQTRMMKSDTKRKSQLQIVIFDCFD